MWINKEDGGLINLDRCERIIIFKNPSKSVCRIDIAFPMEGNVTTLCNNLTEEQVKKAINMISESLGRGFYIADIQWDNLKGVAKKMINIQKQLDYIRRMADKPCTCTEKQITGDDPTVCNSCYASQMYNQICADIRLIYNVLRHSKNKGEKEK